MKWEEEGYTRKDEHGNMISIVRTAIAYLLDRVAPLCRGLTFRIGGV